MHFRVIFVMPALVISIILLLSGFGVFAQPNGILYDLALQFGPSDDDRDVVVVEAPFASRTSGTAIWAETVRILAEFGAQRVVFAFDPLLNVPADDQASTQFTQAARDHDVIVGRRAVQVRGSPDAWTLVPTPALEVSGVTWGALLTPPSEHGIHRHQWSGAPVDGRIVPTLETVAAGLPAPPRQETYLLHFSGGLDQLPRLSLDRVLERRLLADLVTGRTVLVGIADDPREVSLSTPAALGVGTMRPFEYHAFALQTLLSGRAVLPVGLLPGAALIAALCFAGAFVYTRTGPRSALPAMTAAAVLTFGLGYLAIHLFDRMLPVSEILFSQVLLGLLIWRQREAAQDRDLHRLVRGLALHIHERFAPGAVTSEQVPAFAIMASRLMGLERSLFLITDERGQVEQLAAMGCSLADLAPEARRAEWPPYLQAGREGLPAPIDLPDLRCLAEGERGYLVPLAKGKRVFGYWMLGAPTADQGHSLLSSGALMTVADQIADLIASSAQGPGRSSSDLPGRAKSVDLRLEEAIRLLDRRADILEGIIEEIATAVVIFDAVGRLLHVNRRMTDSLQGAGLDLSALSAVDLIAHLAGVPQTRVARMLRHVILEAGILTLPVPQDIGGRRYTLRLSSPDRLRLAAESNGPRSPGGAVMCELADVTEIAQRARLQRTLAEYIDLQLRNDLEAIQIGASLLSDPRLPEKGRQRALDRLRTGVERARDRLTRIEDFLHVEVAGGIVDAYPIDPRRPLQAAMVSVAGDADRHRVRLAVQVPDLMSLVVADPRGLEDCLRALLTLLLQDAREDSAIDVVVTEEAETIRLLFANQGFGMPDDRLKDYLSERREPESPELRGVVAGIGALAAAGASFSGTAVVGQGYRFTLDLNKFA
jgi:CHASE2 domain-containing sensor protein